MELNKKDIVSIMEQVVNTENHCTPSMDVEKMLALVNPHITRKCMDLKAKHKRRRDHAIFITCYIIFLVFAAFIIMDYIYTGVHGLIFYAISILCALSVLSLCCLPLIIKYKFNISERGL